MSKLALERDFGYTFFDDVVSWVAFNLSPYDVYDDEDLNKFGKEWAKDNGYILEEECEKE